MTVDVARLARINSIVTGAQDSTAPADTEWSYGPPLADWLGDDEPDEDDSGDWHIRGLVARDVAQFLAGDPKVGKTMIMESWAVALASGAADWCGFPVYGQKRVLIMPREDSERTTRVRLWQLARGAGLVRPHELAEFLSVDPTAPLNLAKKEHVDKLRAAGERFDVVMIDSFTTAHVGDENSVRDIAAALDPARDLASSTKTAYMFLHHLNGKGNADDKRGVKHRIRGSSAIAGYARHLVGAWRGSSKGTVELTTDGNLQHQLEPSIVRLVGAETSHGKKTLRYEFVGSAEATALADAREKVVDLVSANAEGYASANAILKDIEGGSRTTLLAAVRKELEPDGRLEKRGKRIHARKLVPGTSANQHEPLTGTGSSLFRENQHWSDGEP